MPTREQLIGALRQADAAGDTQAATRFAELIKAQPSDMGIPATESAPAAEVTTEPQSEDRMQFMLDRVSPERQEELRQESFTNPVITGMGSPTAPVFNEQTFRGLLEQETLGPAFNAPELTGIMADTDTGTLKGLGISMAALSATKPAEMANIIASSSPDISITYNKDSKGKPFPILTNTKTGQTVQVNKPGLSPVDVMQGLGVAAAMTPAGRATSILKAGAGAAATEGVLQSAQAVAGGEFDVETVALSAGIGGASKALQKVAGGLTRMRQATPNNEVVLAGKEAGIPTFTSDVFPPQTFTTKTMQQAGEKIPVAGTGGLRMEQQKFRETAVDDVAKKYGEFSWDTIVKSLRAKKDRVKQAAGRVIGNSEAKLDDVGEIRLDNSLDAIEELQDNLAKPGIIKSKADETAMSEIDNLLETMVDHKQIFSSLRQNRSAMRSIVEGIDKSADSQMTSRAKALMQRVMGGMKEDLNVAAKKSLTPAEFAKWKKANSVYENEARELTGSKLKGILDKGDMTPEAVKPMLFSQNNSELKMLYNGLGYEGRGNARAAILSKVFTDLGKRANGITPNSFASELKKYKPQIDTFFKGEERKQLIGLQKALGATRRAQDASISTPTGQQLTGGLTAASLFANAPATLGIGGTVGGLSRLYESAPVRNALLRLASTSKGTRRFESALLEFQTALNAAAQTAQKQQGDTE